MKTKRAHLLILTVGSRPIPKTMGNFLPSLVTEYNPLLPNLPRPFHCELRPATVSLPQARSQRTRGPPTTNQKREHELISIIVDYYFVNETPRGCQK